MKALFLCITMVGLFGAGPKWESVGQPADSATLYVDSAGDDGHDGRSSETAFRTLTRASAAVGDLAGPVTVFVNGDFLLSSPIKLGKADQNSRWTVQKGKRAVIRAGAGVPYGFVVNGGDGIVISGFELDGFQNTAIQVANSRDVEISRNVITHTRSSGWNQAAIGFIGTSYGARVLNNTIEDAGYIGIMFVTTTQSDVSDVVIDGNEIRNVCRAVRDCGAIYINDRARSSSGIVITNNKITSFGTKETQGRAIYLDDWASHAKVTDNYIAGPGTYAFELHGGSGNSLTGNVVDMRMIDWIALYDSNAGGAMTKMTRNAFEDNQFTFSKSPANLAGMIAHNDTQRPSLNGNVICSVPTLASISSNRCVP